MTGTPESHPPRGLEILPVRGIGDVTAGDDLAELIVRAAPWLRDGDVLVVTSKIVSKAEGRLVDVPADGPEREVARQQVLAEETARVVARRGPTTIVQTHHGFVMAAAGIDASNVDKTHLVLLPRDPDASARELRAGLAARGLRVGVIVSDTMGRAWRNGLTDVALGVSGIAPLLDHRGQFDPYGNELQLTQVAVVDEMAAAGELVKGKTGQVPVAVIRGYTGAGDDGSDGAAVLLRDAASDMFSLGTAEARAAGLREAATLPERQTDRREADATPPQPETDRHEADATPPQPETDRRGADGTPPQPETDRRGADGTRPELDADGRVAGGTADPGLVDRALAVLGGRLTTAIVRTGALLRMDAPAGAGPGEWMRLGAEAHRVRAALASEGALSSVETDDRGVTIVVVHP